MAKRISTKERERLFVAEYLKDFNATRAALAAGCPEKGAHAQGYELLQRPAVKELIEATQAPVIEAKKDEREAIRQLLENAANLDLSDLIIMGKTGCTLKEFKEIPKELRILITKISNVSGKTGWKINFEVFSKEKAVEMLARIYGLDKGNGGGLTINNYGNLAAIVDQYPD